MTEALPEHALRPGIGLDQRDVFLGAAGETQVIQGFVINREDAAGGAVFRCHIGNGGAVGQWQMVEACTMKFDELADDAMRPKHFHDGQHQIGSGCAFRQAAGQLKADDLWHQH